MAQTAPVLQTLPLPEDQEVEEQNRDDDVYPDLEAAEEKTMDLPSAKTPSSNLDTKNSTVITGGISFFEAPLNMSPISRPEAPFLVQSTPIQSTKKAVQNSPMLTNLMRQKLINKQKSERVEGTVSTSTVDIVDIVDIVDTEKAKSKLASSLGLSRKTKVSISKPAVEQSVNAASATVNNKSSTVRKSSAMNLSSATKHQVEVSKSKTLVQDWEDVEETAGKSLPSKGAFEVI